MYDINYTPITIRDSEYVKTLKELSFLENFLIKEDYIQAFERLKNLEVIFKNI